MRIQSGHIGFTTAADFSTANTRGDVAGVFRLQDVLSAGLLAAHGD